jgi:hypothetical protein
VFLKLRSGVQEKGRGFWKINNSILQELEYQILINHLIDKQDIIDYADIYKIEGSLVFQIAILETHSDGLLIV